MGISHELNEFNGFDSLNSINSWLIPIRREIELLRVLCFGTRGVALCEPALPAFNRFLAAVATAVGRTDEVAVGQLHPSDPAARPAVFQRTELDRDLTVGLEGETVDAALQQLSRRRSLETPECFAAILVLDVDVEPGMRIVEGP